MGSIQIGVGRALQGSPAYPAQDLSKGGNDLAVARKRWG